MDSLKLNRQELLSLIHKIVNVEGTEEEIHEMIKLLESQVPHPGAADVIFYENWSSEEEMLDRMLRYQPILLGPSDQAEIKS